jgi:hypothetical protein
MAWRIQDHILRGEIDNRTRGKVTGRLWLDGLAEPLVLNLDGDCEPDLAGCLIRFTNPNPVPLTTRPPALVQNGTAGCITAARKRRVFDVPIREALAMQERGEKPAEHLANCLYLEWFSELSGGVTIESPDYRLEVSEPAWRFTAEELAERKREQQEGSDAFATQVEADGSIGDWDEFRSEQMLRESDMIGEKYRRLLEEYQDHPDSERIIARAMGWDWLEEALDEQAAAGDSPSSQSSHNFHPPEDDPDEPYQSPEPGPALEGIDWVHDGEERIVHPIYKRAKDALYAVIEDLKAQNRMPTINDDPVEEFFAEFSLLGAKLAGALNSIPRGLTPDPAMTVARLKRVLEIHNRVLTTLAAAAPSPLLSPERQTHTRTELFALREDILALITRLRG